MPTISDPAILAQLEEQSMSNLLNFFRAEFRRCSDGEKIGKVFTIVTRRKLMKMGILTHSRNHRFTREFTDSPFGRELGFGSVHSQRSMYDPIIDNFIEGGKEPCEVEIPASYTSKYLRSEIHKRIVKRNLILKVSLIGGRIRLEKYVKKHPSGN